MKRCEVCKERSQRDATFVWYEVCRECYEAYYERPDREMTMAVWAARRARRYERARQRRGK